MGVYKIIILIYCLFFFNFIKAQENTTSSYINKYKGIAIKEMNRFHIPASIKLAQAILESGSGQSKLAKKAKNHFGIKCHSNWSGRTFYQDDDEKDECFRKYKKARASFRDHSLFLKRTRYSSLFDLSLNDYKGWANGLKEAGYATNPEYANLLIDIIEKYDLTEYDNINPYRRLLFAKSFGYPYLAGLGLNYFQKRHYIYSDVQFSVAYFQIKTGYSKNIYSNLYIGLNTGGLFAYNLERTYHLSTEASYCFQSINKRPSLIIVTIGLQSLPFKRYSEIIPDGYFWNELSSKFFVSKEHFMPYINFTIFNLD